MTLDGYVHAESAERRFQIMQRQRKKLKDYAAFYSFPYDHVIVDEGQDFGRDEIENAKLLELLHDAVLADAESKTLFMCFMMNCSPFRRIGFRNSS